MLHHRYIIMMNTTDMNCWHSVRFWLVFSIWYFGCCCFSTDDIWILNPMQDFTHQLIDTDKTILYFIRYECTDGYVNSKSKFIRHWCNGCRINLKLIGMIFARSVNRLYSDRFYKMCALEWNFHTFSTLYINDSKIQQFLYFSLPHLQQFSILWYQDRSKMKMTLA